MPPGVRDRDPLRGQMCRCQPGGRDEDGAHGQRQQPDRRVGPRPVLRQVLRAHHPRSPLQRDMGPGHAPLGAPDGDRQRRPVGQAVGPRESHPHRQDPGWRRRPLRPLLPRRVPARRRPQGWLLRGAVAAGPGADLVEEGPQGGGVGSEVQSGWQPPRRHLPRQLHRHIRRALQLQTRRHLQGSLELHHSHRLVRGQPIHPEHKRRLRATLLGGRERDSDVRCVGPPGHGLGVLHVCPRLARHRHLAAQL
mmetsp:Transcript_15033/g.25737  ORF Transcript_15033/g.25737 Transcript_15033/m.25737 type:complete len:250 (+) Transcript_15033:1024-1773(+)